MCVYTRGVINSSRLCLPNPQPTPHVLSSALMENTWGPPVPLPPSPSPFPPLSHLIKRGVFVQPVPCVQSTQTGSEALSGLTHFLSPLFRDDVHLLNPAHPANDNCNDLRSQPYQWLKQHRECLWKWKKLAINISVQDFKVHFAIFRYVLTISC